MKIELRNIKTAQFASRETQCFSATLIVDGVNYGTVSNDGQGGCHYYDKPGIATKLNEYGKTLPIEKADVGNGQTFDYQPDADGLVDKVLTDHLIQKDFQRAIKSRVLFTKAGSPSIFQTRTMKADQLRTCLKDIRRHLPDADKVLNLLPATEALTLYRSAS